MSEAGGDGAWPAFIRAGQTGLAELVGGLEKTQFLSSDEIAAAQAGRLTWLLKWAARNVPWYDRSSWARDRAAALAARPAQFWDEWAKVPLLTKPELREHGALLNTRSVAAAHRPLGVVRTSGSVGIPVEVQTTALTRLFWDALTVREHLWRQRDFRLRLGAIRYRPPNERSPEGITAASWGAPVNRLYASGPASAIHIALPIPVLTRWLLNFRPAYLLTYPSVGEALLDALGPAGKPEGLRELRFLSEPVDASLDARLKAEWDVGVADLYSANEVGYIAFRCLEQGRLHVQSESVLVEILDEAGRACAPGEVGRVVITTLQNLGTPLMRYDIGDYARVGAPCACGRTLPVLDQVMGRVRNLVRRPDGQSFWPARLAGMRTVKEIRQAQYVQTALDTIELRAVLDRPLSDAETRAVEDRVRKLLEYPFTVKVVPVTAIARGPTGKFEEFMTALPD